MSYVGEVEDGWEMEQSTNPSLFLANKGMVIDLFPVEMPTTEKTFETKAELGLSEDLRWYGLERSTELDKFGKFFDANMMKWRNNQEWFNQLNQTNWNLKEVQKKMIKSDTMFMLTLERFESENEWLNETFFSLMNSEQELSYYKYV